MAATICSTESSVNYDAALRELETLIKKPKIRERELQEFFEENPEFLICLDQRYSEIRSHVCLIDGDGNKLVPDFMMRIEDSDIWDIVELKLPNAQLAVGATGTHRTSAVAARGIAELLKYRDYFDIADNRNRFTARYGAHGYEPALVLVLGRGPQTYDWSIVKGRFPQVRVVSYDTLFERAQQCKRVIEQCSKGNSQPK
jgi:hypothetical protein